MSMHNFTSKNYPLNIYAVYEGKDHSVSVQEYPARKRDTYCIECKYYLNKTNARWGMIKLPTNEFYKPDFGKPINLVNCTVTYFLNKEEAENTANYKKLKQYKKLHEEIDDIKDQILLLQERLVLLQEVDTKYISGVFSSTPTRITNKRDIINF